MLLRLMEDGRAVTYVENLNREAQALAIKKLRPPCFTPTSSTVDRPEFAAGRYALGWMEGLMPIHIRCGDKNGVFSQRLDISPVTPKAMLYLQRACTAIVALFGCYTDRHKQCRLE